MIHVHTKVHIQYKCIYIPSTTACKNASTYKHGLKAQCGQLSNIVVSMRLYVDRILSLSPSGGSVTILRLRCKIPERGIQYNIQYRVYMNYYYYYYLHYITDYNTVYLSYNTVCMLYYNLLYIIHIYSIYITTKYIILYIYYSANTYLVGICPWVQWLATV